MLTESAIETFAIKLLERLGYQRERQSQAQGDCEAHPAAIWLSARHAADRDRNGAQAGGDNCERAYGCCVSGPVRATQSWPDGHGPGRQQSGHAIRRSRFTPATEGRQSSPSTHGLKIPRETTDQAPIPR